MKAVALASLRVVVSKLLCVYRMQYRSRGGAGLQEVADKPICLAVRLAYQVGVLYQQVISCVRKSFRVTERDLLQVGICASMLGHGGRGLPTLGGPFPTLGHQPPDAPGPHTSASAAETISNFIGKRVVYVE